MWEEKAMQLWKKCPLNRFQGFIREGCHYWMHCVGFSKDDLFLPQNRQNSRLGSDIINNSRFMRRFFPKGFFSGKPERKNNIRTVINRICGKKQRNWQSSEIMRLKKCPLDTYFSGQIIATSAEVTPNGGLVRVPSPQNPLIIQV